ncbi:SMI1/KNR4 family protein [bacterium]|nr:MAG: SMI1/KNR4 family protein [bacterium]
MMVENPNPYGALEVAQLEEFEKTIGAKLPEEYRAFLLKYNGGRPTRRAFMAPDDPLDEDSNWSEREVVGFYGLHEQDVAIERDTMDAFKLSEAWQDLQTDFPGKTLLPISQDWSGSYICLQLGKEKLGEICFFDHDYEVETKLADNFIAFGAMLTESTEDAD